ncbi:FAD-dependent oxidoreductase [Rhizorhabdus histidinilytica]
MKQSAERSRLSRRAFIQAGGAGLAVSTLGAAASAPAVAAVGRQWTQIADIVVVGSGAAASVAALAAAKDGAKVLMLEKAPVYGGTSAKSGGAFWVPNNFRLKERGSRIQRLRSWLIALPIHIRIFSTAIHRRSAWVRMSTNCLRRFTTTRRR